MATLLERRQMNSARMGYLLVIEGCPYAFTDVGGIVGTTYINDGREILPGLDLPASLTMGLNVRAGVMKEFSTAFRVMDTHDGVVADLFRATFDDANSYRLNESIPATDDPANATYNLMPGLGTVDPRSKHIGTEYIDASRNRRSWYIHPGTHAAPPDHALSVGEFDAMPPLLLTDEPRVWAGRQVALHELVYDEDAGDWATWSEQFTSGSLIWRGTMQGRGTIIDTAQYEIQCDGPASLMRRQLNRRRPREPLSVVTNIQQDNAKRGIAIIPLRWDPYVQGLSTFAYECSVFDSANDISATTRVGLIAELDALFAAVKLGSGVGGNSNFTGTGATAGNDYATAENGSNSLNLYNDGRLMITFHSGGSYAGKCLICMHADYWGLLGYDPVAQGVQGIADPDDPSKILYLSFRPYVPDGEYMENQGNMGDWNVIRMEDDPSANTLDFDGYYVAEISTKLLGADLGDTADNDGGPVFYSPLYEAAVLALDPKGKQQIGLPSPMYIEGQNAFPPGGTYGFANNRPSVNSNQVNAMGWMLLEGTLARGTSQFDDVEHEYFAQVARVCWHADSNGQVTEDGDGNAGFVIECLEDPRAFGFEFEKITAHWLDLNMTATPLAVWAYVGAYNPETYADRAHRLIPRIMLASGTAGSWGTTSGVLPTFPSLGDNDPSAAVVDKVASDVEIADLGLNIEGGAVDLTSWRELAEKTTGDDDPLVKVKLARVGPVQAEDLLAGLLQARGWCMGYLRTPGDSQPKFAGVDVFSPFEADDLPTVSGEALHITESDLAGFVNNPRSWVPKVKQNWRAPVDVFDVQTRRKPREGTTFEREFMAMDHGATQRSGSARWGITDGGLSNPRLWSANDTQWQWEAGFRARWQETIASFMALPNRTITLNVSNPKGQWCYPGQPFLLTNVSVNALDGQSIGVTKAQCVVLEHRKHLTGKLAGNHTITALMLGLDTTDGFSNFWGGSAKATAFVDNGGGRYTLTCEADWLNAGHGGSDVSAFEAPDWSSGTGSAIVQVYQSFDLESFPTANQVTGTVNNVDTGANTVTLTVTAGTLYRDTLKIITLAPYTDQGAGNWVRSHLAFHTDGLGGTHTSGVQGKKLQ